MNYWLMKSEPDVFSLDDLKARPGQREPWDGVRNYQARNFMRDEMQAGDGVLFYHSNCKLPGIVGLAEIAEAAKPDATAWDPDSDYYDPKSSPDNPVWVAVTVRYVAHFTGTVSLAAIKADKDLSQMRVAQRGNRLSITPVTKTHYTRVCKLGRQA